jgi:hypothetical protein
VGALLAAHWSAHAFFTAVAVSIMIGAVACMMMPPGRAKA